MANASKGEGTVGAVVPTSDRALRPREVGDLVPCRLDGHLREAGGAIFSTCVGFAYPRNGNVWNPTPRISFVAVHNGQTIGLARSKRAARDLLRDHVTDGAR